ncbi:MAG: GNAT family N-acetyltransferase [Pseudomonadota bacterium]
MCEFREATENDFEGICKLVKSKEELFLVYPSGKYPFTVAQVRELSQVRKELTVAVDRNEIIGFANLYNYEPSKYAFIGNVVINKSHRGRGLGKEIISYMLKIAYKKHNLPEVRISVFSENTPALLLYSGFGFAPYEIEERKNPQGNRVALIHLKMGRREI